MSLESAGALRRAEQTILEGLGKQPRVVFVVLSASILALVSFVGYTTSLAPSLSEFTAAWSDGDQVALLRQELEVLKQRAELARADLDRNARVVADGGGNARPEAILRAVVSGQEGAGVEVDSLVALGSDSGETGNRAREFAFIAQGSFESILSMVERMRSAESRVYVSKISISSPGFDSLKPKLKAEVTARVE
jgi:hypothetical protein